MRRRCLGDGADWPVRRNPFSRGMRQDRAEPNDPNALIDRGGLHGGDSCWLKVLRTMSSPLDKGAYRKDRSDLLVWFDRIVPTKDFSGLTNCACALARA